jgi:hypothetical protein
LSGEYNLPIAHRFHPPAEGWRGLLHNLIHDMIRTMKKSRLNKNDLPLEADPMMKKEPLEQLSTTRSGDRALRRRRKTRGFFQAVYKNITRLIPGKDAG